MGVLRGKWRLNLINVGVFLSWMIDIDICQL